MFYKKNCKFKSCLLILRQKSCIPETQTLSVWADSRTNTMKYWLFCFYFSALFCTLKPFFLIIFFTQKKLWTKTSINCCNFWNNNAILWKKKKKNYTSAVIDLYRLVWETNRRTLQLYDRPGQGGRVGESLIWM